MQSTYQLHEINLQRRRDWVGNILDLGRCGLWDVHHETNAPERFGDGRINLEFAVRRAKSVEEFGSFFLFSSAVNRKVARGMDREYSQGIVTNFLHLLD